MVRVLVLVLGLLLVGGTSALGTGDPSSPGDGKLETPDTLLQGEPSAPPAERAWQFAQELEAQRDGECGPASRNRWHDANVRWVSVANTSSSFAC